MKLRLAAALAALLAAPALAQDGEPIKIGQTMPYSGPASAYGTIGTTMMRYMDKLNAEGGINGRPIELISYDDGYSPPKTFEQTQRLIESDEVLFISSTLGTPTTSAIHDYATALEVPVLFISSGASKWGDPENYPYTMGWQPDYQSEGRIYARWLMENHPDATISILYQNDDYGKDYVAGLKDGLGDKADELIVAEEPYEVTDPTIDSQMLRLQASGADVFFNVTTPKFAAQAIRKIGEIDWDPVHILNNVSTSVGAVIKPAGIENAQGIVSAHYHKDPTDPAWADDEGMNKWRAFIDEYYPDADRDSTFVVFGYAHAQTLEHLLRSIEGEITREAVMEAAKTLDLELDTLLPGVSIKTSDSDFFPIQEMQMMRFDGESWKRFGDVISGADQPAS